MDPIQKVDRPFEALLQSALGQSDSKITPHSKNEAISTYQRASHAAPNRNTPLRVADIMKSPVYTVTVKDTAMEAESMMKKYGFRHVPVMSDSKSVVGIISERDLLKLKSDAERTLSVKQVMSVDVETILETALVREAAQQLLDHRIGALPVVDRDGGEIRGIVTLTDILRAIVERAPIELWC